MKWTEFTIHTTSEAAELVADLLMEHGGGGVAIYDRQDILDFMKSGRVWDYVEDKLLQTDDVVLVKGFMPLELTESGYRKLLPDLDALKERCQGNLTTGSFEIVTREIDDEDWVEIWKKHYKPIPIGRVVICPEWLEYYRKLNEVVVRLDPGMAFGTGEHETTSLCIELMQRYGMEGKSVADVGCGSGILGITAVKLGARKVLMTDIDPIAIRAAEMNADLNGVKDRITFSCQNLLDRKDVIVDVLLVNIVAEVLIDFALGLPSKLCDGGVVILSGIIQARKEAVISAYERAGFRLESIRDKGEWCALAMRKN